MADNLLGIPQTVLSNGAPVVPGAKVQLAAGSCQIEENNSETSETGKLIRPLEAKGVLYITDAADDGLTHIIWKPLRSGKDPLDFIVFPEDAELVRVTTVLEEFNSSNQRFFFWSQLADVNTLDDIIVSFNKVINGEEVVQESQTTTRDQTSGGSGGGGGGQISADQYDRIRSLVSSLGSLPTIAGATSSNVKLSDAMNNSTLLPLLSNPSARAALFPHLPEDIPRDQDSLKRVLTSPQFAQSIAALDSGLRSGQLMPLIRELNLDPSAATGAEAFLRAIERQVNAEKQESERDNKESEP
ncbi:hypothetical protein GQ42DRAFT_149433 [Ramicandelaber brevisporus]|nr:hypothetical protein GQ42DRAFT_149433 [Ramicandelaber brevisporus]